MPKITYVEYGGREHTVDVPVGYSVMEGAVKNGLPGIDADCGGACACATCHVYVDAAWADHVGQPSEMEKSMLEYATDAGLNSRLTCQIRVSEALDGLLVRLPRKQG